MISGIFWARCERDCAATMNTEKSASARSVILLAPAGDFESLHAALRSGADAVYFGVGTLNMRSRAAANFRREDLPRITELCHGAGARAFLALNTIVYDSEIPAVRGICADAKNAGVDAVIAADPAVLAAVGEAELPAHLSVQANVANLAAVRFYARYADVVVPARELTLAQIGRLCAGIREQNIRGPSGELVGIELFVHGALCAAVSGKCYMSLAVFNTSANRGNCYQPCRRSYTVRDKETDVELDIDNEYIMSPKDLKTIHFMDEMIEAGVRVFKIEGRARGPEYVRTVVECYKEAIQSYIDGTFSDEKVANWDERLKTVFNRGFWNGYYLGQRLGEWSKNYGSEATERKVYAGRGIKYFSNIGVAEFLIEASEIKVGDKLLITGPTTGAMYVTLDEARVDLKPVDVVKKGVHVSFKVPDRIRPSDRLYRMVPAEELKAKRKE